MKQEIESTVEYCERKYIVKDGLIFKDEKPFLYLMRPKPFEADGICFGRANKKIKEVLETGIPVVLDEPARIPAWHTKEVITKFMKKGVLTKRMKSYGNMKAVYSPVQNYIPQQEFNKL